MTEDDCDQIPGADALESLAALISRLPDRDCDQLRAKMIPIGKYRRDR
jgi:hypothetical protein